MTGLVLAVGAFTWVMTQDPIDSGLTLLIRGGLLGEDGDSILGPRSVDELEELLGSNDGFIQHAAGERLARMREEEPFLRAIRSTDVHARRTAAGWLGEFSTDESRAALRVACSDPDDRTCARAVRSLGRVGQSELDVKAIEESGRLDDPSEFARDAAREAIDAVRARIARAAGGPPL